MTDAKADNKHTSVGVEYYSTPTKYYPTPTNDDNYFFGRVGKGVKYKINLGNFITCPPYRQLLI